MQFKHCCYEKVNGFYEIIVPNYPQYNTICVTLEEAEKICRLIDRLIQIKLDEESRCEHYQNELLQREKEFYERQRKLIQQIEEKIRQSREKYLRQLEELRQDTDISPFGMH